MRMEDLSKNLTPADAIATVFTVVIIFNFGLDLSAIPLIAGIISYEVFKKYFTGYRKTFALVFCALTMQIAWGFAAAVYWKALDGFSIVSLLILAAATVWLSIK